MTESINPKSRESEIVFRLKAKKMPRHKADAELAEVKRTRIVEVEIEEKKTETSEEISVNVSLKTLREDKDCEELNKE